MTEVIADWWAGQVRTVDAGMAPPNDPRGIAVRCPTCFIEVGVLADVPVGTRCDECAR